MAVDVSLNTITSGYNTAKINTNFERIATALQDVLSRSGDTPNEMNTDLDMNGGDILNVRSINVELLTSADGDIEVITIDYRGDWSALTQYSINDVVKAGGNVYVALRSNINADPTSSPLDWDILLTGGGVSAGSVGTTELADGAVTNVKVADNTLRSDKVDSTDAAGWRTELGLGTLSTKNNISGVDINTSDGPALRSALKVDKPYHITQFSSVPLDGVTECSTELNAVLTTVGSNKLDFGGYTFIVADTLIPKNNAHYYNGTFFAQNGSHWTKTSPVEGKGIWEAANLTNTIFEEIDINGNADNTTGRSYGIWTQTRSVRVKVLKCRITNTRQAGWRDDDGYRPQAIGSEFIDNGRAAVGTDDHGIMFASLVNYVEEPVVRDNLIVRSNRKGATTYTAPGTGLGQIGGLFENNTIQDCVLGGIFLSRAPAAVDSIGPRVIGNYLSGNTVNIEVTFCDGMVIANNYSFGADSWDMYVEGCNLFTITGNVSDSCGTSNLYLVDCIDGTVTGNSLRNPNGLGTVYSGVRLIGTTDTLVANNIIKGRVSNNMPYGIEEFAGADYNYFFGNIISNWATAARLIVGANTTAASNKDIP